MEMDPKSYAKGVVAGMRNVKERDRGLANQIRAKTFLEAIECESSLDDNMIKELVTEVYYRYFQGNSGTFFMAARLKNALDEWPREYQQKKRLRVALAQLAIHMCENLKMATQGGNQAKYSLDAALWVHQEIRVIDGVTASRLMRACGKGLFGKEIDQLFWSIKDDVRQSDVVRTFAQGMLSREGPANILADYLIAQGRGPKEKKYEIPVLSDDELAKRAHQIRPVVRFLDGGERVRDDRTFSTGTPYFIEVKGVKNVPFTIRPVTTREAVGLKLIKTINTYHPYWRDARLLDATVEQVLAQIPDDVLPDVVAFETYPIGLLADAEPDGTGYHFTTTALYGIDPDFIPEGSAANLFPFGPCRDDLSCQCEECQGIVISATK